MGGWDTMITLETKNILVEAAWFDPGVVRRSSKRHLLHTDASASVRARRGFQCASGGIGAGEPDHSRGRRAAGGRTGRRGDPEAVARTAKRASIRFSLREVRRMLGETEDAEGITAAMADGILTGLGCGLEHAGPESWSVMLPSWRLDLEREIDLIEEIARVYGYNRFQNTLPAFAGTVVELPWAEKEAAVRRTMLALGWNEAIATSFCGAEDAARFRAGAGVGGADWESAERRGGHAAAVAAAGDAGHAGAEHQPPMWRGRRCSRWGQCSAAGRIAWTSGRRWEWARRDMRSANRRRTFTSSRGRLKSFSTNLLLGRFISITSLLRRG